jgi:hypothetical protein
MARTNQGFLSVINNPNVWGAGCGYVSNGISLSPGTTSGFGILSFPPEQTISYFPNGYSMQISDTCYADNTQLISNGVVDYDSIIWTFGDPASGVSNHASGLSTQHVFSSAAIYSVVMIVYGCEPDTIVRTIYILPCILPTSISLSVQIASNFPILTWSSFTSGLLYFEVERSDDGILYRKVEEVAISDPYLQTYRYIDNSPNIGREIWYRIRQVEVGGSAHYSNVEKVSLPNTERNWIDLFPNPTNALDGIIIETRIPTEDSVAIEVFNSSGLLALHSTISVLPPVDRFLICLSATLPVVFDTRCPKANRS